MADSNAKSRFSERFKERFKFLRVPTGLLQIMGILVVAVAAFVYAQAPTQEEVLENRSLVLQDRSEDDLPLVQVVKPQIAAHAIQISTTGTVIVRNSVELVPQVTGRIVWVDQNFRRGGQFEANTTLIRIDPQDFELALAQAEADLKNAQSSFKLAEATSEAAIANYALLNPGKTAPPLVAKTPQVEQAKAQIAAAEAKVATAELNLTRTEFSLPFAGRVVATKAEVGQLLNQGQVFGEVFALDAIEALVPVSPDDLNLIQPAVGRAATITIADHQYPAKVARVSPDLDDRTRFAQLFLAFDDGANVLPGSFLDVEIEGPKVSNSLLLPEAAEQSNQSVWVLSDGRLKKVSPKYINRIDGGILTEAFDTASGVVLGTVPGGVEGLAVSAAQP